jgi:hypothetical protein
VVRKRRVVLAGVPRLAVEAPLAPVPRHFQILSSLPTRIRIHIPDWRSFESSALKHRLQVVTGVCAVHASPLTQNVLIHFDPVPGVRNQVLSLIDSVLTKCGETGEAAARPRNRVRELQFPVHSAGQPWLKHAPAVLGLIASVLTCGTPLGVLRVALETLALWSNLSPPATG